MIPFAELLDRLSYEPRRNAKIALVADYLRHVPDPDRGFGLAALTGGLTFANAKPGLIRALIAERTDPVLFALSYDYVGDLSETAALMWPMRPERSNAAPPTLTEVVARLSETGKADLPAVLAEWLDRLDETGRFALLKLITGSLRIGVSARLAKTALSRLGEGIEPDDVEEVWHGQEPPYEPLFAWIEGRGPRPASVDPAPFRPPMLSHPIEERDFAALDPADFAAEWKWDGIRVQAAAGLREDGRRVTRLFSRTGDDISAAFPDVAEALDFEGAIDGELLVMIDGQVQPFNALQQRLNRKTVTARMLKDLPAHIRAYDLLAIDGEDWRGMGFSRRRDRLDALAGRLSARIDLSPLLAFASWAELAGARADPAGHGAGADADAVEGVMIKRRASPYLPGRPRGEWFKWKRDPHTVDAVLMYAQRGHGKRSSFYSDYTFGVWREVEGTSELVPVGKAYFGFTDEELKEIDRFVRRNTVNRFGPVREVVHEPGQGLVVEVAFEGLARSTRHKSGLAMRFPRIARLRWDKLPADADRLDVLEALLAGHS